MTRFVEPLEVPMGRTLLALARWNRSKPTERLTVAGLACADFALRFPVVLMRLCAARPNVLPLEARPSLDEELALENGTLMAQLRSWNRKHRLVVGALVGRDLARLTPAVSMSALSLTARGSQAAEQLAADPRWRIVDQRAVALNKLRLGSTTLVERCEAAVEELT